MGYDPKGSELQMVSFHSVSKGYLGECGLRGGYFELFGIDDDVKAQLYKIASISLCSNTVGQVRVSQAGHNPPGRRGQVIQNSLDVDTRLNHRLLLLVDLQITTGLMVNPPKEGSPSYALFDKVRSKGHGHSIYVCRETRRTQAHCLNHPTAQPPSLTLCVPRLLCPRPIRRRARSWPRCVGVRPS